jgi:hypothetical protein
MILINSKINISEIKDLLGNYFDDMVKAVIDIKKELLVIDSSLHTDEESLLLENGSKQDDLWGINLYPLRNIDEWIEYESIINIKPQLGNRSIIIQSEEIKEKINEILDRMILR